MPRTRRYGNEIADEGAIALADALVRNATLHTLNAGNAQVTEVQSVPLTAH